jgi:hypothetical protein
MRHDPLSYRVVLLSESQSPPKVDEPLTYHVVPLAEESSTPLAPHFPEPQAPMLLESRGYNEEILLRRPRRRRLRLWKLETRWDQCLRYPVYAWRILGGLAAVLTVGTTISLFVLMNFLQDRLGPAVWFWLLLPLAGGGYVGAYLHCVLASAVAGEAGVVRWPGNDVALVLKGFARCFFCVLAGPIFLLATAFAFWLQAGDLAFVDGLILMELILGAAIYWLFAFVAVTEKNGIRHAAPADILELIYRLRWSAVGGAVTIAVWTLFHGLWLLEALSGLHRTVFAFFSLGLCAASALFWLTFLLRWLGVCSFLSRTKQVKLIADCPA